MPYIDFNEVKAQFSIETAVQKLGLKVAKSAAQLRGACPVCKQGGDRALAITPARNLFYCFAAQAGGDQLALVAHIREVSMKEAAEWLTGTVQNGTSTSTSTSTVSKKDASGGFAPLDYLQPDHDAVAVVGFDVDTAKALGIGYAPKGILRGLVAIPVRLEDGTLAGYIGITEAKLPPRFHLETKVVPFQKKTA